MVASNCEKWDKLGINRPERTRLAATFATYTTHVGSDKQFGITYLLKCIELAGSNTAWIVASSANQCICNLFAQGKQPMILEAWLVEV